MINIENISFRYGDKKILDDISFDLASNEIIAILGNNGAGKSTLLNCMCGLYKTEGSQVYVRGEEILAMNRRAAAKRIAYVAQKSESNRITVFDAVLLGRKPYIKWDASKKDIEIVDDIISQMELESVKLKYIDEISGGELQKVMLARALSQEPRFLLLDEPTSSLDPRNQYGVLSVVRKIAKEHNIAVAIVLHDLNLALRYCDKFLFLKDSEVLSYGGIDTVTPERLEEVYGMKAEIEEYNGIKVFIPIPDDAISK